MKLCRFGAPGEERPGILLPDGARVDASGFGADWNEAFFAQGADGMARLARWVAAEAGKAPRVPAGARLASAVARPSKIVCIGLNFRDHARESGAALPAEPIVFMKATTCLGGPHDPIELPPGSQKTDWEVELGIVIGRTARRVTEAEALSFVAGYCVVNDVSERAWQMERGGTWDKGKGFDTFGPVGPWLVTTDEVSDPQALSMWLDVNGESRQRGHTSTMIFGAARLVSYLSECMTLLPGDLIATGTPPGVGMGRKPPQYLRAGDVVTLGIEGLGAQRQDVRG